MHELISWLKQGYERQTTIGNGFDKKQSTRMLQFLMKHFIYVSAIEPFDMVRCKVDKSLIGETVCN